eukprot:5072379-Pleurochrysis_carterae.AAC.1
MGEVCVRACARARARACARGAVNYDLSRRALMPCRRTAAYRLHRDAAAHSKGSVPESIEKRMMPSDHMSARAAS